MGENTLQRKQHPGWTWIVLNIFSWGAFILIAGIIGLFAWQVSQNSTSGSQLLSHKSVNVIISSLAGGLCWGAIVGRLQKSFLVRHLNVYEMHWTSTTIIGFIAYLAFQVSHQYLPLFHGYLSYSPSTRNFIDLAYYFAPPLALGIAQWSILRLYFRWSGLWIVATTLGVGCAEWANSGVIRVMLANGYNSIGVFSIAVYLIDGLAYGLATWLVLALFTHQRNHK